MKKNFLTITFTIAFAITSLFIVSCCDAPEGEATDTDKVETVVTDDANEEKTETEAETDSEVIADASYQCPMECEGDKTYKEEGTCPKCNMDLKKVETSTTN